jgi:uncharacterized protein YacL (UPF0231 family)
MILPQLRQKVKKLDIVILFLQDILLTAKPKNISTLFRSAYLPMRENTIFMGDSCSTKGSNYSFTLGGKIGLKDGARELEMGLTNRHCLLGDDKDEGEQSIALGCRNTDSPRVIVSISEEDHAYVQAHIKEEIREEQKRVQSINETLKTIEESSAAHQKAKTALSNAEKSVEVYREALKITDTFSRDIGTVYTDSGSRIRDNPFITDPEEPLKGLPRSKAWLLDWGLIQLCPPKSLSSKLQGVPSDNEDLKAPKTYIPNNFDVTEYATISPDDSLEVMKRGRTTRWTHGVMSAVISTHRRLVPEEFEPITPSLTRDDIEGFQNVACYSIVARPDPHHSFIESGDSGCLVLLNQKSNPGVILGLGFANNPSLHTSYMLPMDLVVHDIKEITGMDVLEPKYAGVVRKAS